MSQTILHKIGRKDVNRFCYFYVCFKTCIEPFADRGGIKVNCENKWLTLIQNGAKIQQKRHAIPYW